MVGVFKRTDESTSGWVVTYINHESIQKEVMVHHNTTLTAEEGKKCQFSLVNAPNLRNGGEWETMAIIGQQEIKDWKEILFDFIDVHPCFLPHELFEWLEKNYETPKKKKI